MQRLTVDVFLSVDGWARGEALAGLPQQARDASWHRLTELDKVVFSGTLERTNGRTRASVVTISSPR